MPEQLRLHLERYPGPGSIDWSSHAVWATLTDDGQALIGTGGEPPHAMPDRPLALLSITADAALAAPRASGILACTVDLPWPERWLLRVDRIALGAGSITPRHRHAGPGIRLLVAGRLDAMVGRQRFPVTPGQAWLETPTDDIIGRADPVLGAVFHRFVILPPDLIGGATSFIARSAAAGDPTAAPFAREQHILAERILPPQGP